MKDTSAKILMSPLILTVAWKVAPSVVICVLAWLAVARWGVPLIRRQSDQWRKAALSIVGLGAAMNATVTIANGGYMPVVGGVTGGDASVWVTATESHRLLWLADHQSLFWGASIGDCVVTAGLLVLALIVVAQKVSNSLRDRHLTLASERSMP